MTNKTDLPRIRIKPLNDLVLLQRDKKNPTHGKVIECRVLAVGPGDPDRLVKLMEVLGPEADDANMDKAVTVGAAIQMPVAVGDVVLVCEEALHPVTHDGIDLDFCHAVALFGAVELD